MRDSIYRVSLDIHDTASQVQLISLKGDTARHIEFTLVEDGKPFKLSAGDTATVAAKKPDGTTALNACEIYLETGVISFDFTAAFVAVNGLIECNLRVMDSDNKLLTSPRFTILVNEMAFAGTGVTSTDEWTLLSQKITAANTATTAANTAATSANTAATAAAKVDATAERDNAGKYVTISITDRDGTTHNVNVYDGAKGDTGAAFTYDDFTTQQLAALKGPKGDTGATPSLDPLYSEMRGYFDQLASGLQALL